MFTEFGKIIPNIRGKVKCVVILENGEETVEWCSLAEIRQAVEAVEHSLHADGATHCPNCCNLCKHENCTETCPICNRPAGKA